MEKRNWRRYRVQTNCRLILDGIELTGQTVDLSPGGLLVELPAWEQGIQRLLERRKGEYVTVEVPMFGGGLATHAWMTFEAEVVRSETRGTSVRIAFSSLRTRMRRRMDPPVDVFDLIPARIV